jgi:hypothetical protein
MIIRKPCAGRVFLVGFMWVSTQTWAASIHLVCNEHNPAYGPDSGLSGSVCRATQTDSPTPSDPVYANPFKGGYAPHTNSPDDGYLNRYMPKWSVSSVKKWTLQQDGSVVIQCLPDSHDAATMTTCVQPGRVTVKFGDDSASVGVCPYQGHGACIAP